MEPWGTPQEMGAEEENELLTKKDLLSMNECHEYLLLCVQWKRGL